jgi:putative iron-dependent peroxidase
MSTPQTGILPAANSHALFLTFRIRAQLPDAISRVRRACAAVPELTAEVAALDTEQRLSSVVAVDSGAWDLLFPSRRPTLLRPFRAREQGLRRAPSTPADLLLHLRGERRDLCFELARRCAAQLGDAVALVEEVAGFRYLDDRDLTGFVDGTENPVGEERAAVALVGEEDPAFAGGSYIQMQRYIHDLGRWETLKVGEQEPVIGRTKYTDQELPRGVKPPSAHINRVVIEDEGEELEILRHSMPYGGLKEAGLVFIAYARTPDHFDRMLDNMVFEDEEGFYDRLLDFTRPVTGCAFFAPSLDMLAAIP